MICLNPECKAELSAASRFCSRCGRAIPLLRSENEIRAILKALADRPLPSGIPAELAVMFTAWRVLVVSSLEWSLGNSNADPRKLLDQLEGDIARKVTT